MRRVSRTRPQRCRPLPRVARARLGCPGARQHRPRRISRAGPRGRDLHRRGRRDEPRARACRAAVAGSVRRAPAAPRARGRTRSRHDGGGGDALRACTHARRRTRRARAAARRAGRGGCSRDHHRLRALGSRWLQGAADRLPGDSRRARRDVPPVTRDSLVLCAGTIPRASFPERVVAARAGGFDGVSLRLGDYARARAQGLSDPDIRALLAGEGVSVGEVEALTAWRPGITPARPEHAESRVLAAAEALRARAISVVEGPGAPLPLDAATEAFATLCDRAAAHGLLVHIEPWPGSALDLAAAASVVQAANRPNGGLLVDTWHLARTRNGTALLGTLPGAMIGTVQVSASPPVEAPEADYLAAALGRRLIPGDGALDLVGFVRLLDAADSGAPIGVEVCSEVLAAAPPEAVARRVGRAVRAVLAAAR